MAKQISFDTAGPVGAAARRRPSWPTRSRSPSARAAGTWCWTRSSAVRPSPTTASPSPATSNWTTRWRTSGAQLAKTAATKTNDVAGDGTTTATVLAQALVAEGLRNVAAGADPLAPARPASCQAADKVGELLKEWATPVDGDRAAIAQVGTIASRDELIGDLLGEALDKVGADGVVTVEEHVGHRPPSSSTPTACSSTRATSRRTS